MLLSLDKYYVGGAITLAKSIRESGSKADLVIFIIGTSPKEWINALKKYFNRVLILDDITIDLNIDVKDKSKKFEKKYNTWLPLCFNKFHVLNFIEYEKVVLMDIDMLCLKNPDLCFKTKCPAGILTGQYSKDKKIINTPKDVDSTITENDIEYALKYRYGMTASFMMLEPNKKDFENILKFAVSIKDILLSKKYTAGPDEIVATLYYKNKWNLLDKTYSTIAWNENNNTKIIHYVTDSPWDIANKDIKIWKDYYKWYKLSYLNIILDPILFQFYPIFWPKNIK